MKTIGLGSGVLLWSVLCLLHEEGAALELLWLGTQVTLLFVSFIKYLRFPQLSGQRWALAKSRTYLKTRPFWLEPSKVLPIQVQLVANDLIMPAKPWANLLVDPTTSQEQAWAINSDLQSLSNCPTLILRACSSEPHRLLSPPKFGVGPFWEILW